jgi:hypothetical protein
LSELDVMTRSYRHPAPVESPSKQAAFGPPRRIGQNFRRDLGTDAGGTWERVALLRLRQRRATLERRVSHHHLPPHRLPQDAQRNRAPASTPEHIRPRPPTQPGVHPRATAARPDRQSPRSRRPPERRCAAHRFPPATCTTTTVLTPPPLPLRSPSVTATGAPVAAAGPPASALSTMRTSSRPEPFRS